MAQALIRNIDDKVLETFRRRASEKATSLEAELRETITKAARLTPAEKLQLSRRLIAQSATEGPLSDSTDIIRYYRDTNGGRWVDETDDRHERSD